MRTPWDGSSHYSSVVHPLAREGGSKREAFANAERRQKRVYGGDAAHCVVMETSLGKFRGLFGTPDRSRTCDLQNRNLTLYPAELRVRVALFVLACGRACARRRGEAPEACSLRTKHYHFSLSAGDCPAFWGNGADGCTAGRRGSAGRAPCKAGRRRRQRRRRTDRQSTSRRPPARTAG